MLQNLKELARTKLATVPSQPHYPALLTSLIVQVRYQAHVQQRVPFFQSSHSHDNHDTQGVQQLKATEVEVTGREIDAKLVQQAVEASRQQLPGCTISVSSKFLADARYDMCIT